MDVFFFNKNFSFSIKFLATNNLNDLVNYIIWQTKFCFKQTSFQKDLNSFISRLELGIPGVVVTLKYKKINFNPFVQKRRTDVEVLYV
jgi:hypothetical protein